MAKLPKIHAVLDLLWRKNKNDMLVAVRRWFDFANRQIRSDLTKKYVSKDITSELTDWSFIEKKGIEGIKPVTLEIIRTGGEGAFKIMQLEGVFDIVNVRAVSAAEKITATMVKEVTAETKKGIRLFIKNGVQEGKSMPKIAKELRPHVGLTEKQTQSVINFSKNLAVKHPEMSAEKIRQKTQVYSGKVHRRRMEMIARTETARAQSEGILMVYADENVKQVEFSAYPDACEICTPLDGNKYNVGRASGVIPVHPHCRCAWLPVVA